METVRSNVFFGPVFERLKDITSQEEKRHILQTDLRSMHNLLLDITTKFENQQEVAQETIKIWLQLLHNSLAEAKSILHRPEPRQQCLAYLVYCNPEKLSKEIKEWKVLFNYLFQGLQRDFSVFVSGYQVVIEPVIAPIIPLMKDVIHKEEERRILQIDYKPVENLLLNISDLFQDKQKAGPETLKIWLQHMEKSLTHANSIILRVSEQRQRRWFLDCFMCYPMSREIKEWKVLFTYLFERLQIDFSIFLTATPNLKSSPLTSLPQEVAGSRMRDLIPAMRADKSIKIQPLSEDEARMVFRRIASYNSDVEEFARKIADSCKGSPLSIAVVSAAMMGKTSVDDWKNSADHFMKTADHSIPDTHDLRVDPDLYQCLKLSYDALPNSNLMNCFLYCAVYPGDYELPVETLVHMWIAEGLVGDKHENHLMDMAIGRSYVNLLVDRFLFQNVENKETMNFWKLVHARRITVHPVIRDMAAIYIGKEEGNCVLIKAGQQQRDFPEIDPNDDCKRISLCNNYIETLPNEFTSCPKLVSLFLSENKIREIPSGFLVSLTSLKVLDLSSNNRISSIPSSIGQLKQLVVLILSDLSEIKDLPEEICHLSSLQVLHLQRCKGLQSLPSKIGQLTNLKVLDLWQCTSLTVIPNEISQLTALSTVVAAEVKLSLKAEAEASIWGLKGLRNLTTLYIEVKVDVQEGTTSSGFEVGIMGTWLEMRHLLLGFTGNGNYVMNDLPLDMQKMSKLQSFFMWKYHGLRLPDCISKFQHLEYLQLFDCPHLNELSPLDRLPNLKLLKLHNWPNLKELGIGISGRARGFLMLEKLVLRYLPKLESIAGASNNGLWNEAILPRLRVLKIRLCPSLKRLPNGMEKLESLSTLAWWQTIIGQDHNLKSKFQKLKPKYSEEKEEDRWRRYHEEKGKGKARS